MHACSLYPFEKNDDEYDEVCSFLYFPTAVKKIFHISLLQFIDIGIIESTYNFFINVQTADFVDLTEHGNF